MNGLPRRRPFLITRSASIGRERFAQTWSGDNSTSWHTLRYNLPIGLGLALSGFAATTHDAGGFFGRAHARTVPSVDPGLNLHPRFLHELLEDAADGAVDVSGGLSVRARGDPAALPAAAYLYSLFVEHSRTGAPIHRPLAYAFPDDPRCLEESGVFMLGPSSCIPRVFEPRTRNARVYLPGTEGWYDFEQTRYCAPGDQDVPLPLEHPTVLARAGPIPLGDAVAVGRERVGERREVRVFPHVGSGTAEAVLCEDDGISDGVHSRRIYGAALPRDVRSGARGPGSRAGARRVRAAL